MTKQEFLEKIVDVDSLSEFCSEYGYESYTDDLYSSDAYDEYLEEDFAEAMRNNSWRDVRDMMNNTTDPYDENWWVRSDYDYEFYPADDEWLQNTRDELLEELEYDEFFEEEDEDDEDDEDLEFEVEEASVFLTTA